MCCSFLIPLLFICFCNPQRYIFNYSLIYLFLLWSCNLNPAADLKKFFISSVPNIRSRCLMIDVQFSHPYWSVCITISLQNFPNIVLFLVKFASIVSHTCTRANASVHITISLQNFPNIALFLVKFASFVSHTCTRAHTSVYTNTHTHIGPILKAR